MTAEVTDFRFDRVGSALAGTNPTVLRRTGSWRALCCGDAAPG